MNESHIQSEDDKVLCQGTTLISGRTQMSGPSSYSSIRQDDPHLKDTLSPVAELVVGAQPVHSAAQQVTSNSNTPALPVGIGISRST